MSYKLVLISGSKRREIPLGKQPLHIGRDSTVEVLVNHDSVSRRHCKVWIELGQILVRDLDSTNGTFVNGERVENTVLTDGDQLQVGPIVFAIYSDERTMRLEPGTEVLALDFEDDLLDPHASVFLDGNGSAVHEGSALSV